jgi:hypothetical protein
MVSLDFWNIIIFGLASFRLTRLIIFDKITQMFRDPFFDEISEKDEYGNKEVYIIPKTGGFKGWLGELLSCHWCTGIWVSIFLYCLNIWFPEIGKPIIMILAVAAVGSIIETILSRVIGD